MIVKDRHGGSDIISVSIAVTDVNEPPVLVGADVIEYAENSLATVGTFTASDPEGESITSWSLSGDDSAYFSVDDSGSLAFIESPDYEDPLDENGDNSYALIVEASDGSSLGMLKVTVVVTDVDDGEPVTATPVRPEPQATATAILTPTATAVPTPTHTVVPTATARPTATPTQAPIASPTVAPTAVPTRVPTPTVRPTATTAPAMVLTIVPTATALPVAVATEDTVPAAPTQQPVAQPPAVETEAAGGPTAGRLAVLIAAVVGTALAVLIVLLIIIWRRQRAS